MSSPAEPSRSPQEALLHLEKSSGSPTSLLNYAADILGLNLALCASHPEINRLAKTRTASAPKAEWVLRWLLKKLKTSAQFRVQPASFLLLTQLITLIHPKALAAILTEYEFLRIVKDVFADLEGAVFTGLEDGFAEVAPSGSESSLTLGSSPVENRAGDKKGTKRKRSAEGGNGDSMEIDETPQTSASCLLAFICVLDCLYSLVVLVTETLGDDEVARSRLTQAIRCGPESGALMLAKSFRIAAIGTSHFFQCRMITDLQHLMYVVPAVLGIWRLRASQDASETKASNDYFAKYCFPSALRLQHCISHTDLDTDERSQALFGIQRLIAVHVVLPARMAFLERGGSGIDYSADEPDWSAVKPVTDTFRPLLCGNDDEGSDSKELPTQARKMKESWKTAELLPAFFDTAARCVPRDTFRRQNHEAPWLETLLVAVAELAFSFAKEENPSTYFPEFVGVLEQLFRVVLDRDVKLSLHTLLTHASYSGLLKGELAEVEWNLTALLIKLGVDIFLPNSGFSYSKKLLNALLEKIMLYWRSGTSDGNYDVIKYGIVIPLARGFTAARDLPTFMELWYEQLVAMEEARIRDSSLSYFSVWEDDDLCAAYGELVQTPFMDTHIVAQMRAAAADIKGTHGRISTSPSSYAKFVVLEASLRTRRLNLAAADESLLTIVETLSATLSSKQSLHWRWRLWRLTRNLLENNLQSTNSPLGNTLVELITVAAESIHRRHKDFSKTPCAPLENFEAYRFTLVAMNGPTNSSRWDKFNTITEEVLAFIKSVSNGEASKSMNSPWNGRMETLNSQSSLALGYFLLLVRSPSRWEQMQVETRRALFEHIVKLAASQYDPRSSALDSPVSDARFLQAWASLVCHEYLLNSPNVIGDLVHVLADCVKRDPANRKLYVMSLQRIPAPSFTRRQRGIVLDLLQGVIIQESNSLEVTVGMVSLMAKLADLPKSSAAVTNDWEPIWKMAKAVSLEGAELDLQIVKAFRSLHRAVITKLLVLSSGERSKQFPKLFRKLESMVSHMRSIDENSMGHALLQISLTHLWTHREELSNVVDESTLGSCREKVFDLVVGSVKRVKSICKKQESGKTVLMTKILDSLDDFQDLATGNAEVVELLEKIEDYVEKSDDFKPSVQRLIRRCVLAGQEPKKEVTQPMMRCAEIFSVQYLYGEDQQLFIRAAMEKLRSMTMDDLVQVMAEITGPGAIKKDCQHLVLVAALVAAALPPVEDKDTQAAEQLSSLFTVVSQVLVHCKTIEQFAMATECLDTLFHQHPRCVDQFDIDGLLSAISLCLSRYGPHINPRYASAVYVRLCRLVGVFVGLLRQRVGGRHHLIINILTRLLNCLLDRSKKQGRALEKDKNQPYWIAPLQASDAAHFTRLLTSLSDPTLSSVSRPSAHEGLTDQTKKAKRITGQYLQYFVMEYARMSLQGTFSPQIKAAIMPGLYSILDGLSREAMRSLNAELEVSSRAVFKGLYDDYAKFGKWNKA